MAWSAIGRGRCAHPTWNRSWRSSTQPVLLSVQVTLVLRGTEDSRGVNVQSPAGFLRSGVIRQRAARSRIRVLSCVVSMSFVWWRQGAGASRVLLAGHSAVTTDVGFDGGADEQEEAVAVRPTPGQDGFGQTELGGLFDDRELIGPQGGAPLDQGMGQRQVKPEHRILRGADHRGAAPGQDQGIPQLLRCTGVADPEVTTTVI